MVKQNNEDKEINQSIMRWLSIGIEFCIIISIFVFLGHLLDKKFAGNGPWFMILGFFVGFAIMMYWMIKSSKDIR